MLLFPKLGWECKHRLRSGQLHGSFFKFSIQLQGWLNNLSLEVVFETF